MALLHAMSRDPPSPSLRDSRKFQRQSYFPKERPLEMPWSRTPRSELTTINYLQGPGGQSGAVEKTCSRRCQICVGAYLQYSVYVRCNLQSTQAGKLRVAYPTLKRLLIHIFCAMNLQILFECHETLQSIGAPNTKPVASPIRVACSRPSTRGSARSPPSSRGRASPARGTRRSAG